MPSIDYWVRFSCGHNSRFSALICVFVSRRDRVWSHTKEDWEAAVRTGVQILPTYVPCTLVCLIILGILPYENIILFYRYLYKFKRPHNFFFVRTSNIKFRQSPPSNFRVETFGLTDEQWDIQTLSPPHEFRNVHQTVDICNWTLPISILL
jgi:hypothetical protein